MHDVKTACKTCTLGGATLPAGFIDTSNDATYTEIRTNRY